MLHRLLGSTLLPNGCPAMNRLRWHLVKFKCQLGWVGLLGLVGLFYGAIYYFTAVSPAKSSFIVAHQALLEAKKEQLVDTGQTVIVKQSPIERQQNFTANFPNVDSINVTWQHLAKLLEKSGLIVEHSVYESSPEKHAGLFRYRMNMPIKAAYPQIRDFLAEVMQAIPNAALESVYFKRESVDSPIVDANISLVIYVRAQ